MESDLTTSPRQLPFFAYFRLLCCSSLLFCVTHLPAAEPPKVEETRADKLHRQISGGVVSAAEWLDSFLDDENYLAEENRTRLRVSFSSFSEKDEGTDLKAKFSYRLRLPQFENRLQLVFSGSSDDFDTTGSDWEDVDDEFGGTDEESLSVGLRYFFRETARHNTSVGGGIRFRSGSPILYVQPRYRYFKKLSEWDMRFIQKIAWFDDSGFESNTRLQLEKPLPGLFFFRTTADLDWYEEEDGVFPQLRFVLRRPLSKKRVLSFQFNNYFETRPDAVLDSTVLKLRYRQRVWRDWLWFEVAPQVAFPREKDYDATPGILLKVQADFGPGD